MALTKRTAASSTALLVVAHTTHTKAFAPLLHRGGYLRHTHKLNKGLTALCKPCQFTHSQGLHKPTDHKSVFRASYDEPRPQWPPPSTRTQRRCSSPARRPDKSPSASHLTPWLLGTHLKASYDLYRLQAAYAATSGALIPTWSAAPQLSPIHFPGSGNSHREKTIKSTHDPPYTTTR